MTEVSKEANILFLFWGRKGGGARYSYEISKELCKRDDLNLFLSVSNQCDLIEKFRGLNCPGLFLDTYDNVKGFISQWVFNRRSYQKKLTAYLKENKIDTIILGMDFFWGGVIYKAARKADVKTIYVVHEPKPHPKEPFVMGLVKRQTMPTLIKGADHLVALTDHVKEYLTNRYSLKESGVSVIPHGIFSYYDANEKKELPKKDEITILYFGTITYYKGLDILLQAYKILEEKYESLNLEIWGEGDLEEYEELLSKLKRVRVENRWIDEEEIPDIFERSNIIALPYRDVSQSGIVGAASKAALPIVACPAEGLKEQMMNEGIVYSNDFTPKSLAEAIEKLLTDPEFYSERSNQLLNYSKTLSWASIAEKFKEISDDL